jgi:hypothetical protein
MDSDIRIRNAGFIILDGEKQPILEMGITRNQAGKVVQLSIFLNERLQRRLSSETSLLLHLPKMDCPIHYDASECPSDDWDWGRRMATPGLIHLHTTNELNPIQVKAIEELVVQTLL